MFKWIKENKVYILLVLLLGALTFLAVKYWTPDEMEQAFAVAPAGWDDRPIVLPDSSRFVPTDREEVIMERGGALPGQNVFVLMNNTLIRVRSGMPVYGARLYKGTVLCNYKSTAGIIKRAKSYVWQNTVPILIFAKEQPTDNWWIRASNEIGYVDCESRTVLFKQEVNTLR